MVRGGVTLGSMGPLALSLWFMAQPVARAPATEVVVVPPEPQQAPAPVPAPIVARPAAPLPMPLVPTAQPIAGPPNGKWMRVGGGLAIGLGALLGVSALASYAVTDGLEKDDLEGRRTLEAISLGLGVAAVAHIAAGVPLWIVGKQRQRRHAAWSRRVVFAPRLTAGRQGLRVGLTLRF